MRTPILISLVSAAALAGSLGVASAAQPDMPSPNSYEQSESWNAQAMTGASTTEQVASNAADLLRDAGQQIPAQFVSAAKCVAVFPNKGAASPANFKGPGVEGGPGSAYGTGGSEVPGQMTSDANTPAETAANPAMRAVGVASCRDDDGNWTSTKPAFVKLMMNGAELDAMDNDMAPANESNAAATIDNSETLRPGTSLVLLFVDDDAADDLMSGGLTLGDDADVAAGPTGQSADTSSAPAAVLAYRGTPGAGLTGAKLDGAIINFDELANQQAYGEDVDATDLLEGDYEGNGKMQTKLTAYNQALSEFAPASEYKSKTSIAK